VDRELLRVRQLPPDRRPLPLNRWREVYFTRSTTFDPEEL
jgi:hypothetical protein